MLSFMGHVFTSRVQGLRSVFSKTYVESPEVGRLFGNHLYHSHMTVMHNDYK